jgi:hypothetical protein
MNTRSCAHHTCDQEFTTKYPTKKYCSDRCKINASQRRHRHRYPEKKSASNERHYWKHTVSRGQRLQERLDSLFRAQAAVDPSGLPQLASRVLTWSPKGYSAAVQYARHPQGPLERDWLYYSEYSPEEAVVVYERED